MIKINTEKAKTIAHDIRRTKREEEFAPLDAVIMKQIPGNDATRIEEERQAIRDKYTVIQTNIDSVSDVSELKTIVDNM